MAGASAGGFGAGFAKGLANFLLANRQEQTRKREREENMRSQADMATLPTIVGIAQQSGDYTLLNEMMERINPDIGKKFKKFGSPFDAMAPFLSGQANQPSSTEIIPDTGGIPRQVTAAGAMPSQERVVPHSAAAPISPKTHLLGTYMPTPEEREQRATTGLIEQKRQIDVASVQRARDVLTEMRKTNPQATLNDAFRVIGVEFPAASVQSAGELVSGVDASGKPATGIFVNGQVIDLTTRQPIPGFQRTALGTGATAKPDTEEQTKIAFAKARGKTVEQLTDADLLEFRRQYSAAGRAPEAAAAGGQAALAAMVAENPSALQGKTPTLQGEIMTEIAKNPQLYARFETNRMKPIRERADQILSALDKLLIVDANGKVTGLTPGAQAIFGEFTPASGRDIAAGVSDLLAGGGGNATDAYAALQQVSGQQILDLIGEMKAQSQTGATGFGQLSVPELEVLTSSASQLTRRLSEGTALAELTKLRERTKKITLPSTAELGMPQIRVGGGGAGAAAGAGSPSGFSVEYQGQTHSFDSQAKLDLFKRQFGIP